MPLSLEAFAKINWFLLVRGRRPDGFHDIESLMQKVSLADTLTFAPHDGVTVQTEAAIPEKDNLVYKAAVLLKQRAGVRDGARITLVKRTPSPAGLGGGSSDAAAALVGLVKLWGVSIDSADLSALAASLGSDVPFFLGPPTALVSGRGEIVSPLPRGPECAVLIAKPPVGVPTPWAYARVRSYSSAPVDRSAVARAIASGDPRRMAEFLHNDLEPPVIEGFPVVGELKRRIESLGAIAVAMSGSGPSVFGIFATEGEASLAAAALPPDIWRTVARTLP